MSPLEDAKVYHKKCLAKRHEAVALAHKTAPMAAGICLLLGVGLIAFKTQWLAVGALGLGAVLFVGIKAFATIIEPR